MRLIWCLSLASSLSGCLDLSPSSAAGAKAPSSRNAMLDPTAPDCPESSLPCVGGRECAFDAKTECTVCHCAPPLGAKAPDVGGVPPVQ
jgi:hypothetical protein